MAASASADAECPSSLRHVEEAGELEALVQRLAASGGRDAAAAFPRFSAIVSGQTGGGQRGCVAYNGHPAALPPLCRCARFACCHQ